MLFDRSVHLLDVFDELASKELENLALQVLVLQAHLRFLLRSACSILRLLACLARYLEQSALFFGHDGHEELVHVLLCALLHVERRDLPVVDCALFQDPEEVDTVLKQLVCGHGVAEVLRHLNDDLLDCQEDDLLLVGVVSVELALEQCLQEKSWLEYASASFDFCIGGHCRQLEQVDQGAPVLEQLSYRAQRSF